MGYITEGSIILDQLRSINLGKYEFSVSNIGRLTENAYKLNELIFDLIRFRTILLEWLEYLSESEEIQRKTDSKLNESIIDLINVDEINELKRRISFIPDSEEVRSLTTKILMIRGLLKERVK